MHLPFLGNECLLNIGRLLNTGCLLNTGGH